MADRKGNYAKFLKTLHTEQLAKLQLKNQQECDLLDDIRQFTSKKSAIEKTYSEQLLKISAEYLNKKSIYNIPDIKLEGAEEKWNMWSVWRTVLEENEKLARARLAAIEVFQTQITEQAKILRDYKVQISKKSINQLGNIQKEVQLCVSQVDLTKKSYFDEEHSAHDVRDKARNIEEKLKKKKGSFFQSITSLQKNSARVTSRKEQLEEKSTGARNDYLLSLASANAHQNRYFTVDLQTTMTNLENYVYDRVAEYLTLMGRTELITCSATQHSYSKVRDQAQQLTREYNLQCCYLYYPVLKQHIHYEYEPCDNDKVTKITAEHESAAETLAKEAKNLAARVVRENITIRESAKKLASCVALRDAGQRVDPNDQNGLDLDTKIEDLREAIRKAETEKTKAEACLECLKAGGVNVDEWIQEAETLGVQELPRSSSSFSLRTDDGQGEHPSSDSFYDSDNEQPETSKQQQPIPQRKQSEEVSERYVSDSDDDMPTVTSSQVPQQEQFASWEDPTQVDWGTSEAAAPVAEETQSLQDSKETIFKCTALYSYTAQNPDELTIVENEQLEVIGEGDGDGWLKARNYRGEEGYVPHNYLDVERETVAETEVTDNANQISFSSVDYTVENEDQEAYQDSIQSSDQVSVISAPVKNKIRGPIEYCVAMYDYDATAEDELTFEEGQIIRIIKRGVHEEDDGWWEGELDGKIGNFPSLVVEECDENGEPLSEEYDESPPPSSPPVGLPPCAPPGLDNFPDEMSGVPVEELEQKFAMELNKNQQKQYGTQFNAPPVMIMESAEDTDVSNKDKPQSESSKTFGLGVVQISVTAATPMHEEAETEFPTIMEEKEPEDDTVEDEPDPPEPESDPEPEPEPEPEQDPVSEPEPEPIKEPPVNEIVQAKDIQSEKGESSAEKQSDCNRGQFVRQPTIIKPERPPKKKKVETPPSDSDERMPTFVAPIDADGSKSQEVATTSLPKEKPTIKSKPHGAIKPTVQPPPPPIKAKEKREEPQADENAFEANFEANFDDAFGNFGDEQQHPIQVVGGRASIPEELDSHQLERLQNLKESNA